MEGVVVSAKKDGSTITVSVISDGKGRYSFPANRLEPGHYTLKTRAVGYVLDGAGAADVAAQKTASADLALKKTKNIVPQMTNAEWIMSVPGTDEQKSFLLNCVSCHTLERIVRSTHDADEFTQVIYRMMGYAQVSQPIKPQRRMETESRRLARAVPQAGGISGDYQPEQRFPVGVSAKNFAAAHGQSYARDCHRVRFAASDN